MNRISALILDWAGTTVDLRLFRPDANLRRGLPPGLRYFRIGNIGEVYDADITALLAAIDNAMYWKQ